MRTKTHGNLGKLQTTSNKEAKDNRKTTEMTLKMGKNSAT